MSYFKEEFKGYVEGATVRQATHADYAAVMDIQPNLNQGFDYLPCMYYSYIDNPRRQCAVCIKDDQIVGFSMTLLVDGGSGVVFQSGRTKQHYQGQGISSLLSQHCVDILPERWTLTHTLYTTLDSKGTKRALEWKKQMRGTQRNMVNIMQPFSLSNFTKSNSFRKACSKCNMQKLEDITPTQLFEKLPTAKHLEEMFPFGLVVLDREPMRMEKVNQPIIEQEFECVIFASFDDCGVVTSVSFSRFRPRKIGMQLAIDVYFKNLDSTENLVASHILKQLFEEENKCRNNEIIFQVTAKVCNELKSDYFPNFLKSLFSDFMDVDLIANTLFIMEEKLAQSTPTSKL